MIDRMCDLQKHLQNVEYAAKLKNGKEISLTSVGTRFASMCFTCKKKGHRHHSVCRRRSRKPGRAQH
jgi:hypothetical protein